MTRLATLSPRLHIYKPGPAQDYTQRVFGSPDAPRGVAAASATWLQVLNTAHIAQLVVLSRQADNWWVIRAWTEHGMDNAGRPMTAAVAALVVAVRQGVGPGQLLLAAYQAGLPIPEGDATELPDARPISSDRAEPAAVANLVLALDLGKVAYVELPETADTIWEAVGPLDWVVLAPHRSPPQVAAGRGIVITDGRRYPRVAEPDLEASSRVRTLRGLYEAAASPEARRSLLHIAAGADGPVTTMPALSWLLEAAESRARVLGLAEPSPLGEIVAAGTLLADEVVAVLDRLPPTAEAAAARALSGRSDLLQRFLRHFGLHAPHRTLLLDPEQHDAWRLLADRGVLPSPPTAQVLADAGLLADLTDARLVELSLHAREACAAEIRHRLLMDGLSPELVAALAEAGALETPPVGVPPCSPRGELLAAIDHRALVGAGRTLCADPAWRAWWAAAVDAHPVLAREGPVADAPAWSEPAGIWLDAAVRGGEVALPGALRHLARWQATGCQPAHLADLLRGWGLGIDEDAAQATGLPVTTSSPTSSEVLSALRKAGLLGLEAGFALAARRRDIELLEALGASVPEVCLLDDRRSPPLELPGLHEVLRPWLADHMRSTTFWARWRGSLDGPMAGSLAALVAQVGGVEAQRAAEILAGQPASGEEIMLLGPALPTRVLLRQISDAMHGPRTRHLRRLELLLDEPRLSPPLVAWLRAFIFHGAPMDPPPLTPEERLCLLPLLDPVREVLLPLLHAPSAELPEDLMDALLARLARAPHAVPGRPPGQLPRWTDRLASLPGWEHWSVEGVP